MLTRQTEGWILIVALVSIAAFSWWMMLRPVVESDPTRFDGLDTELRGWRSVDLAIDQSVSDMLAADHNVQRAYVHDHGYVVYVYVGYYGTERGGTPEHTPDSCYPAQGWTVVDSTERKVGREPGFTVREFLVEQGHEQRVVHFWYRTAHSTGITSIFGLRLEHFWGRLTENRGEGALIRLSTRVAEGDVAAARSRLIGLDVAVEAELARVWGGGA